MSTALLALFAVILCILFRILNVNSAPRKPLILCQDQSFLSTVLKIAPAIAEPYKPTRLWGFSGHVQTIVHSVIGRVRCPWPIGVRVSIKLADETTLTYDLYQPLTTNNEGHTDDYHVMLQNLIKKHPNTKIICIGFSLGGNIVTKYLGERGPNKLSNIIGGISICQGYNAIEGTKFLLSSQNLRRFYMYILSESVKSIILKHKNILLSEEVKQRYNLNEGDIISAATLLDLDEAYTRRVHNFRSVKELYKWSSSLFYLENIATPMVFINALDDPIVPEMLLDPIKEHAKTHPNTLYIELAHGGHLGFFEGGLLYPNSITWLDRTLVSLVGSLTLAHADKSLKAS